VKPLTVIPAFLREPQDLEALWVTLESLRASGADTDVMVVDDASPAPALVDEVQDATARLQFDLHRKEENEGFSRAVNVGLRRALQEGRDAVLANADLQFRWPGWLDAMLEQPNSKGNTPGVVGALLTYPSGLIQHAGIYFSWLRRSFDHIHRFAPAELPEAHVARVVPVTGALQLIRHATLMTVGLYDEDFRMGYEDVDFCVRALKDGVECVYCPQARAVHFESMFRGEQRGSAQVQRWEDESWRTFMTKHAKENFWRWVPSLS
jgi:GT2 family glycosyltransferase